MDPTAPSGSREGASTTRGASSLLRAPIAVPRIERPSLREFRDVIAPGRRPAVITGAIAHWPALSRWNRGYFRERFGAVRVPVYAQRDAHVTFDPRRGLIREELSLAEFVDQLSPPRAADALRYRLRCPLLSALPEAMRDISVPEYCASGLHREVNLWFSGADTVTHLHFDLPNNLLAQVVGPKRFLLFGPEQSRRLYRYPITSSTPQFSQVDLTRPNLGRFPRLAEAVPHEARLEPGDMLFIPSRWWHYADSPALTMSVNFWWTPPALYPAVLAVDLFKRLRGLSR